MDWCLDTFWDPLVECCCDCECLSCSCALPSFNCDGASRFLDWAFSRPNRAVLLTHLRHEEKRLQLQNEKTQKELKNVVAELRKMGNAELPPLRSENLREKGKEVEVRLHQNALVAHACASCANKVGFIMNVELSDPLRRAIGIVLFAAAHTGTTSKYLQVARTHIERKLGRELCMGLRDGIPSADKDLIGAGVVPRPPPPPDPPTEPPPAVLLVGPSKPMPVRAPPELPPRPARYARIEPVSDDEEGEEEA